VLVLDLPDSVHAMVMARVDTLRPDELLALKVASVIGHSFALSTLAAIHPALPPAGAAAAASTITTRRRSTRAGSGESGRRSATPPLVAQLRAICERLVSHHLLRPCGLLARPEAEAAAARAAARPPRRPAR